MRIVVFGPGHPYRGGIARTTTELVQALRSGGRHAVFRTPRRQYPRWLFPGAAGDIDPEACPVLDDSRATFEPVNPRSWLGARREARSIAADAWIIPYWTWAWAPFWLFLLRGRRPPAVAVVHNPADHGAGALRKLIARKVIGRCQGLFTHASSLAEQLLQSFPGTPVASHPIPVLPAGELPGRSAARSAVEAPAGRRVALYLGIIRPYKGVDVLLEAASRLPKSSDWFVVIAGEPWGDLDSELKRQFHRLKLDDRARLDLRWVPEQEIPTLLAAADVVVLPYRSGTQSAVAPMALAHGLPVIASAVGGLPEVVEHGVNGLLVEPGSVEGLASALRELDSGRQVVLAEGARAAADRLSWASYAEAIGRLLDSVVDE